MRFFIDEQLGEKQSLTPEGFLLCADTPIARTGTMLYGPNEVPIAPGPGGVVRIHRDEDEVFRPEFMASFHGKPVVNDHPMDDVNPDNWRDLTIGTVLNPRRGEMLQQDLLIADLLIYDKNAIELVRSGGKREVSCGYDADYAPTTDGEGKQINMLGNHVALVDSGRCGPRCAIGDHNSVTVQELMMFTRDEGNRIPKAAKWWAGLVAAITSAVPESEKAKVEKVLKDQAPTGLTMDAADPDESGNETHIHIHPGETNDAEKEEEKEKAKDAEWRKTMDASVTKLATSVDRITRHLGLDANSSDKEIEGKLEEEAPAGTGDAARKARDSAHFVESYQETVALAEVLVPGIQVPTFDRAAPPIQTYDSLCKLRRTALDLAYHQTDGRAIIDEIHGKPLDTSKMECRDVKTLFKAVAASKKRTNNAGRALDHSGVGAAVAVHTSGGVKVRGGPSSLADLNRMNAERYGQK